MKRSTTSRTAPRQPQTPGASLPPYGDIPKPLVDGIADFPVPEGYDSGDGRPAALAWPEHYRSLVDRIAETLWPRWGGFVGRPGWEGAAAARMHELTELDLALTIALQPHHVQPVSQRAPRGGALGDAGPHAGYFEQEDPGRSGVDFPVLAYLQPAERVALYEATRLLAQALNRPLEEASFPRRLEHWSYAHPTAPTLPSKRELQRPRPHQVASLRGLAFEVQRAPGAVTSATPSGHAIQGLMGVVGAVVELKRYHRFDAALLSRLRQYAVDVGDRRVFAGVHFPTDNLASWCLALSLCPRVYGRDGDFARAFMAEAITRHSAVHAALVASGSPLLKPGLDWLNELL